MRNNTNKQEIQIIKEALKGIKDKLNILMDELELLKEIIKNIQGKE